jgi:hypothetical protein
MDDAAEVRRLSWEDVDFQECARRALAPQERCVVGLAGRVVQWCMCLFFYEIFVAGNRTDFQRGHANQSISSENRSGRVKLSGQVK